MIPLLTKHPFPVRAIAGTYTDDPHRHKAKAERFLNILRICCGGAGDDDAFCDEERAFLLDHGAPG